MRLMKQKGLWAVTMITLSLVLALPMQVKAQSLSDFLDAGSVSNPEAISDALDGFVREAVGGIDGVTNSADDLPEAISAAVREAASAASAAGVDMNNDGVVDIRDRLTAVRAAAAGAVRGAMNSEGSVADGVITDRSIADLVSDGAVAGAVEDALETGADVNEAASAASAGAGFGAILGASDTGADLTLAVQDTQNGSAAGARRVAEGAGLESSQLEAATQAGLTQLAVEEQEVLAEPVQNVESAQVEDSAQDVEYFIR